MMCVCGLVLFLAPSIYENMDIKKGILLQLFSGSQKDFDDSGRGKFRYDTDVIYSFWFRFFYTKTLQYTFRDKSAKCWHVIAR